MSGSLNTRWRFATLSSVCHKIQDGAHHSPSVTHDARRPGTYPYVTSKNIRHWHLDRENISFVDEDFHNSIYPRCNAEFGDILLTKDGANTGQVTLNTFEEPISLLSSVCLIKPDLSKLDPRFLVYYIQSDDGFRSIAGQMTGAAIKRIVLKRIKCSLIPLPPLDEQKRIVAALDQAFAALDRARANAEANLADSETVFEQALLATFDELLAHASMSTLADMSTDFSRGKSKHRPRNDPKLYGGAYPFIQTGDVRRAQGAIREYSQTYNDVGLAQSKLWPVGTVCITIAANIAETGVLEIDACFPDSVIGMVPDPARATPYYVEYMLRYFSKELKLKGKGSAQDNINLATFEDSMFPFPSLAEQEAIVDKLDDVSSNVSQLRSRYSRQMEEIDELRQSLLQAAFSGQLS